MTTKGSVDTMGIERDDRGIVVHGGPGCTCTASGEDPRCPHHGYEAVIQRLEAQLVGAVEALREIKVEAKKPSTTHGGMLMRQNEILRLTRLGLRAAVGGQ